MPSILQYEIFTLEEVKANVTGLVVKPLCSVQYAVDRQKLWLEKSFKGNDKLKHRRADFQIYIILGNAALEFAVVYQGDLVGYTEATYMQRFD